MPIETGLIGLITRTLGGLFNVFGGMRHRRQAQRWVGVWEPYNLVGRDLAEPMKGGGPATVSLPPWWKFSTKLSVECYDCDEHGQPLRRQTGHITIHKDDPDAATRIGHYTGSAEFYEQRLRMLDTNTIFITPVPGGASLGDIYGKHGWRRKRKRA